MFKPASDWTPPSSFPDLSQAKIIGLDLETKDPYLQEKGPGTIRRDGHVAGIAVSSDIGFTGYYPIGHLGGGNLDKDVVLSYMRKLLSNARQIKVGANLPYDLEWLRAEGVRVRGNCHCVQQAEALLNEERKSFSLESLAQSYLGVGKEEGLLREAASIYGVDPKKELWKLPAKYVGAYAESDAHQPIEIFRKQFDLLEQEDLLYIFDLESKLIPVLLDMRFQGVPVDLERANETTLQLSIEEEKVRAKLKKWAGFYVNEWSNDHLAEVCRKHDIPYTTTAKGNPSFTKDFLRFSENPFLKAVTEVRTLHRLRTKFIEKDIIEESINGRIHAQFHQLRKDEGGTRTGRFSSSNPNLQQVPKRDERFASLIRSLFISDPDRWWAKLDYSQQEPRLTVHYAYLLKLSGAMEYANKYRADPRFDFYDPILRSTGTRRRTAKDLALGRNYGMGEETMASRLNTSKDDARRKLEDFDQVVPFIKELFDICQRKAEKTGWIKTILGRKRHFNYWEPYDSYKRKRHGEWIPRCTYTEAEGRWPGIRLVRGNTRNAFNSLIQGSAADMMKKAMLDLWMAGVIPYLTVHDETGNPAEDEDDAKRQKKIMEDAVKLEIPVICDLDLGRSWYDN